MWVIGISAWHWLNWLICGVFWRHTAPGERRDRQYYDSLITCPAADRRRLLSIGPQIPDTPCSQTRWVASEKMPLITLTLIVIGIRPIQQKMGPKNTISAKYKTYKYFHQKIKNLPSWKYAEQCVSLRLFRDQSDALKPTSCIWDFAQTASNF